MRTKLFLIPVVLMVAVAGLLVAVHLYDAGRPDRIAEGIRVAGIDVGGMAPEAARVRLEREFEASLERPVVVRHGRKRWHLRAREAHVRSNVSAMVTEALARSDAGGPWRRTARRLTGGTVSADLQPDISFSSEAVGRLVRRVRRAVDRPAHDATLSLTAAGPVEAADQTGLRLKAKKLRAEVEGALGSPTGERTFIARTKKLKPKVTRRDLVRRNAVVLIADRAGDTLRLYRDLKLEKSYAIAAGQPAWPTPAGAFTIANKTENPAWSVPTSTWSGALGGKVIPGGSPENPLKARWLGITDGVGIHGTSDDGSIGSNASHGCLRMHVSDVLDLYPRVPVGTPILIV